MIRFIHTADIHYGMENYGTIDPQTGIHTRLLDFDKAFNFCIDYAIEESVDFFLIAGDVYKTTTPSPTQQQLFLKALLKLYKANIPVVIVIGNHDNPLSFGKATPLDMFGDLPLEGFHVIAKPTALVLDTKSGPVQIVGIPWPTRNTIAVADNHAFKSASELTEYISQSVAKIIAHYAKTLNPDLPAVLTGHLTVASGIFSGSEKRAVYGTDPIFMPSQLAVEPFDYVALGHLHRYQNLNPAGYPAIIYSGSPERIDFGERKETKGFCVVTLEKKGTTSHEFITTPQRPFIQLDLVITHPDNQTAQIIEEVKKHNLTDAILKITYTLPPDTRDTVDLVAVQRTCIAAHDIVGIIPIHQTTSRERRNVSTIHMDLEALLENYFNGKPELKTNKQRLINKTLMLKETLMKENNE